MATTIEFEKYKDAGTGNYTILECNNAGAICSALVNILTNRKKGYPRVISKFDVSEDGQNVHIVIDTQTTTQKIRSSISDPTME